MEAKMPQTAITVLKLPAGEGSCHSITMGNISIDKEILENVKSIKYLSCILNDLKNRKKYELELNYQGKHS